MGTGDEDGTDDSGDTPLRQQMTPPDTAQPAPSWQECPSVDSLWLLSVCLLPDQWADPDPWAAQSPSLWCPVLQQDQRTLGSHLHVSLLLVIG